MTERYRDRTEAGRRLADTIAGRPFERPIVLGLPRGGVPVAAEVAAAIKAPLDVLIVRKLRLPRHPEVAMGAIGEGGARVLNDDLVRGVTPAQLAEVEQRERAELDERVQRWRLGRAPLDLSGRDVLLVDDGIATGATARAACRVARTLGAGRLLFLAPVGAPDAVAELRAEADEVICPQLPEPFLAVGMHYLDFGQTPDDEVTRLLAAADATGHSP